MGGAASWAGKGPGGCGASYLPACCFGIIMLGKLCGLGRGNVPLPVAFLLSSVPKVRKGEQGRAVLLLMLLKAKGPSGYDLGL